MYHKLFLLILFALNAICLWAGDAALIVKTKTAEYIYLYSQHPAIIPDGQTLTLVCESQTPVSVSFDEVECITSTEDKSVIDGLATPKVRPAILVKDGKISISDAEQPIGIYDISGKLIASGNAGSAQFAIPAEGVYVVRIGSSAFKINVAR